MLSRHLRFALAVTIFASALAYAGVAEADQGGVSFWLPGIYASMAAVPPTPGFSVPSTFYFYSGKADSSRDFGIGGLIATGVEAKDFTGVFLAPTWVPEETVANGRRLKGNDIWLQAVIPLGGPKEK
jgi:hypothetical protein